MNARLILLFAFLFRGSLIFSQEGQVQETSAQKGKLAEKKSSVLIPAAIVGATYSLAFLAWTRVNKSVSQFAEPSAENYSLHAARPPRWDHDAWQLDYIAHPWVGAETYLLARNFNNSVLVSFLFSTGCSLSWEYGFEAFAERPSLQDLIITSTTGSVIGEVRYSMRQAIKRIPDSAGVWYYTFFTILLDPLESIVELFQKPGTDPVVRTSLNFAPTFSRSGLELISEWRITVHW